MKRLPVALVAGFVLQLATSWGSGLWTAMHPAGQLPSPGALIAWQLATGAAYLATHALLVAGLFDLARRSTGLTGNALRVAALCEVALVAFALIDLAREPFSQGDPHQWWYTAATVRWALNLGLVLAIVAPVLARARGLAIGAAAFIIATWLPPIGQFQLLDLLELSEAARRLAGDLITTLDVALIIAMLSTLVRDAMPATAQPGLAASGLSLATRGFYLRIAGFGTTVVLVLVVIGNRGRSADDLAQLAIYAGFVVNAIGFAMVGAGALRALRSAHAGLDTLAMLFAACANLWCAGATLHKLATYYVAVHGGYGSLGSEAISALDLGLPIVATISGAIFTTAIAQFARRRGDAGLAASAVQRGVGYVTLMLASTGIAGYLVADADSLDGMIAMMLVAAACGLASQLVIGQLCRRAGDALADESNLPTATVV